MILENLASNGKFQIKSSSILKFLVCLHDNHVWMVYRLDFQYNSVETPRKFTIAKLLIRELGPSSVLIIMLLKALR